MGLFDKLFNDPNAQAALKQAKNLAQNVLSEAQKKVDSMQKPQAASPAQTAAPVRPAASAPSGDSWGEEMPAEENQYNFNGTYDQFFQSIFRAEFPDYTVQAAPNNQNRSGMQYVFRSGDKIALVVEVMTDRSVAQKLRRACEARGIPYLRFYHDHPGWWNTRSYVVRRVRAALQAG
ncbi:MAG: hypothetical protein IK080_12010 [Clostridia bacterium]|nr:hypothetical protein [Clostridia bacterium]